MALFVRNLYVRISRDLVRTRDVESGREARSPSGVNFTGRRLLVATFSVAEAAIRQTIEELEVRGPFQVLKVLIQQLEMNEGGLSQIESRLLRELAMGAGAAQAYVWNGQELTDSEVVARLKEKQTGVA